MGLSSDQIEAFYVVAKELSFSKAALKLGLSQPALSIRIKKLEDQLGTSLFVREFSTLRLTDTGQKLLAYSQMRNDLEEEFLHVVKSGSQSLTAPMGIVKIAGFSTVVNSVLVPALTDLVYQFPTIQFEIITRELHELKRSLQSSEVDFVLYEGPLVAGQIESTLVGYEENVLVESINIKSQRRDIYLDNDPEDMATINFFREQKKNFKFTRWYVDTASTLMVALEKGWGRAVHPRHIIANNKQLCTVEGYKSTWSPVTLNYFRQPYYSQLHLLVREHLIKEFRRRLNFNKSQ